MIQFSWGQLTVCGLCFKNPLSVGWRSKSKLLQLSQTLCNSCLGYTAITCNNYSCDRPQDVPTCLCCPFIWERIIHLYTPTLGPVIKVFHIPSSHFIYCPYKKYWSEQLHQSFTPCYWNQSIYSAFTLPAFKLLLCSTVFNHDSADSSSLQTRLDSIQAPLSQSSIFTTPCGQWREQNVSLYH